MDDNYKHPSDEKKVRFKVNILGNKNGNRSWVVIITAVSFFMSVFLSFVSSRILEDVNNLAALFVLLLIIFINVVFDIIGIAVTAADETPFHAMASRKFYGAKQAINLIRNANKVSSFCNDVVGDIAGVISGTASAYIVVKISANLNPLYSIITGLVITGLVAALTVGGKAVGKTVAIHNSNFIVYKVSIVLSFINGKIIFGKQKNKRKKSGKKDET